MSKVFFTSDLHFAHKNIMKFCPLFRPYQTLEEMEHALVALWNQTVSPEDIVYNLGDFSFSRDIGAIAKVLRQLNGQHHLIYGNHDNVIVRNSDYFLNTLKDDGIPLLTSAQPYLKLMLESVEQPLILFHYPIQEWDGCHKGWFHLYGHVHDRIAPLPGRLLNVGYDLHGRFLSAADINTFLGELPWLTHHTVADTALVQNDVENAKEQVWTKLLQLNYRMDAIKHNEK
ncbi:MAG: metallophosphoesterase [Cardiobacteriaceae bacterium]|nr:metallophosphoesterase [Cardiobacteriaceae bacterium]